MENKENEREERKGNGIFLGIVGVATLIVAIIGASFAYFSIQASSDPGAVNVTAYQFSASLSMSEVYGPGEDGIIPVDPDGTVTGATAPDNTNLAYAINVESGTKTRSCTDGNGYGICALYEVTVSNDSDSQLVLNGVIKTVSNEAGSGGEAFSNLQYRLATINSGYYTIGATGTALGTTAGDEVSIGQITVPAKSGENPGTYTTYILIYLNELKVENVAQDQSVEMGASYSGQIIFTSNGTANQLTGTFNQRVPVL